MRMAKPTEEEKDQKVVCRNREASRYYQLEDRYEAGIALRGTEVKSLREGSANLKDAYCDFQDEELYLIGAHISAYPYSKFFNHNPDRSRKLLLHRSELKRLLGKVSERGFTIVPLKIYFKKRTAKLEIALARGKKLFDHREDIKKRDMQKEMRREFKYRVR
jgi:SsrA-binding protein